MAESTYFGPERAQYSNLEMSHKDVKDLRGDVERAFLRTEGAYGHVIATSDAPVDAAAWTRYRVGTGSGAFAGQDGKIATRKESGAYTAAVGWWFITPAVGDLSMDRTTKLLSYCTAIAPAITWAATGAATIAIVDAGSFYVAADVEAALAEIHTLVGAPNNVYNFTKDQVLADNDVVYVALNKLDTEFWNLAQVTVGLGATKIGIEDAAPGYFTGTTVEAALRELGVFSQVTLASVVSGEGAALIGIEDAAAYFTGTTAEAALAEVGLFTQVTLASVVNAEGAALIGVEDAAGFYTAVKVEAALIELATLTGSATSTTFNFTEANVLADNTPIYPCLEALDLKFGDVASNVAAEGAALVGVETDTGYGVNPTLEEALQLLRTQRVAVPLGCLMGEDGTALTKHAAAPTPGFAQLGTEEVVLQWATHAAPAPVTFNALLPEVAGATAVTINFLACVTGADTPVMELDAYFLDPVTNKTVNADVPILGGVEVIGTDIKAYFIVLAGADVPAGPTALTVILTPKAGELGADSLYVFGVWVTYTRALA